MDTAEDLHGRARVLQRRSHVSLRALDMSPSCVCCVHPRSPSAVCDLVERKLRTHAAHDKLAFSCKAHPNYAHWL